VESAFTYRVLGVPGETRRADAKSFRIGRQHDAVVAGWVVNELRDDTRRQLQQRLLEAGARGVRVLILEPIARRMSPWWTEWEEQVIAVGGRADEWRFRVPLPDLLKRLDHAAGLRHDELTARSLLL
jgi:hypothetical protein